MTLVAGTTYWGKWGRSWKELADGGGMLGELSFTDAGKVCLFIPDGSLLAPAQDELGIGVEYADYLYGYLDVGSCIVLQDCHYLDYCRRLNGTETQAITANTLLSCEDAFDPNVQIDEVSFRLQHLERWATPTDENNVGIFSGFIQNDKPAPCIEREWYSGEELNVWLTCGPSMKFDQPSSIDMKRDCKVTIKFASTVTLDEAIDKAYTFLLFVSFCAGWYAGFTEVVATNSEGASIDVIRQFHKGADSISALHKQTIPYRVFEPRCSNLIERWLYSDGDFKTAIREYVPIALYHTSLVLDFEFIAASQIIETLARAINEKNSGATKANTEKMSRIKGEAQSLEEGELKTWVLQRFDMEKKARLKEESEALKNGELKDWVLQKLDEEEYLSLRQLLKNLYSYIGDYSKEVFPNKEVFARRQYDRRNPFIHRRSDVEDYQDDYLRFHTKGLFMLSQAAIMRLLGFEVDEVSELLNKCHSRYVKYKIQSY